jgi:hypothetical protein
MSENSDYDICCLHFIYTSTAVVGMQPEAIAKRLLAPAPAVAWYILELWQDE